MSVFMVVSQLMRAVRQFRLPTTNTGHTTPWKSESLITAGQSFNLNYAFILATKTLLQNILLCLQVERHCI
jgi:hypothetical protein